MNEDEYRNGKECREYEVFQGCYYENYNMLFDHDFMLQHWKSGAGPLGLSGMWTDGKYKELLWRMRKGSALDHIRFLGLPKVREKREYRKLLC